ncbi:MAG TPA: alanine racemase [Actinomycetota bacterium]|nr:alanine racemase [Actinomycetota bacterium]
MTRPAWVEIDLKAIRANVRAIIEHLTPGTGYLAVVKANAYGHGDVGCAKAALQAGATWLGVILVDEAIRLRDAGIDAPILLLHEPPPDRAGDVVRHRLTPSVFTEPGIEALGAAAERAGAGLNVHLKIDTGLNRLGVPHERVEEFARALAKEPRLSIEGVFSHFAFADDPGNPFIDTQIQRYVGSLDRLAALGITPAIRHMGNSAAALTRPDAHFDLVRVGIATYGLTPAPALVGIVPLTPALSLRARVAMVKRVAAGEGVSYGLRYRLERPGTIVSLPLGYADGWVRALSGNAEVLIGGKRHPTVGTVCMDSFMADIGDEPCEIGDEAVLIGSQGSERITAGDVAGRIGTINYEVVTLLTQRLERVFVD